MRLSTLREISVLSLRLAGRVGRRRASVTPVMKGEASVGGGCDLERIWEGWGLVGSLSSQRGIYKNLGCPCRNHGETWL